RPKSGGALAPGGQHCPDRTGHLLLSHAVGPLVCIVLSEGDRAVGEGVHVLRDTPQVHGHHGLGPGGDHTGGGVEVEMSAVVDIAVASAQHLAADHTINETERLSVLGNLYATAAY